MPKNPTFKVVQTKRGWKVEKPASLSATGQRERCFFKTRDKAQQFATKLKEQALAHGANAATIRPALADEATRAADMLKPYGISLLDAAKRIAQIEKDKTASMDVAAALAAFLLEKDDKGDWQRRAYEKMGTDLQTDFEGRMLSTITPTELYAHVDAYTGADTTFNSRATSIKTFWRWCSKLPRNWCDLKTVEVLEKRKTRRSAIGVMSAEQCRTLLETAEEHYPECVPGFAISLFTGMRQAELARLDPDDITHEGITLRGDSTKTNRRRFVEMPAPLEAWLKAYPVSETVLPANWFRKEKAVRRKAGWGVWCDLFDPPAAPEESPDWPDNGLRHTHASVMVALGKPLDNLTFEFGHSGGAAVLKAHYVGVMTKAEAIKIWSIGPNGTVIPVIESVPSPFSEQAKAATKAAKATKSASAKKKAAPKPKAQA
jgi:integrase